MSIFIILEVVCTLYGTKIFILIKRKTILVYFATDEKKSKSANAKFVTLAFGSCHTLSGSMFLTSCECYFSQQRRETQVGFAEFSNTADNRANIGGTIIGAPIVGQ